MMSHLLIEDGANVVDASNIVSCTHYINPHLFWIVFESTLLWDCHPLQEMEIKLRDFCATANPRNYREEYEANETVGVFHWSKNKWIRAQVLGTNPKLLHDFTHWQDYILWCIDYGTILLSSDEFMKKLKSPLDFKIDSLVLKCGLNNIVPAAMVYDLESGAEKITRMKDWSMDAVTAMEKLITNASKIVFTIDNIIAGHNFGTMIFHMSDGNIYNASEVLLIENLAIRTTHFLLDLTVLKTTIKSVWCNHSGPSNVEVYRNIRTIVEPLKFSSNEKVEKWCGINFRDLQNSTITKKTSKRVSRFQRFYENEDDLNEQKSNIFNNNDNMNLEELPIQKDSDIANRTESYMLSNSNQRPRPKLLHLISSENFSTTESDAVKKPNRITIKVNPFPVSKSVTEENFKICKEVLIHGSSIKPIESPSYSYLSTEILKALHWDIPSASLFRVQMHGLPAIIRGQSCAIISPSKTGKKTCYLPAICNQFVQDDELRGLTTIILGTSERLVKIENILKGILKYSTDYGIKITRAYSVLNDKELNELHSNLFIHTNILLITPPCLERLLVSSNKKLALLKEFNLHKVQQLVYEGFHEMQANETFRQSMAAIHKMFKVLSLQIIITSEVWDKMILKYLRHQYPILCIGDFMEAAVYGNSQILVKITNNDSIDNHLIEQLKLINIYEEKTIIFCKKSDEILHLKKLITEKMDCPVTSKINGRLPDKFNIFVSDDELYGLHKNDWNIYDCNNIIHYSLPEDSKSMLKRRFGAHIDLYNDLVSEEKSMVSKQIQTKSVIFINVDDKKANTVFMSIMKFMISHKLLQLTSQLNEIISGLSYNQSQCKPLCPSTWILGECKDIWTCNNYRHEFLKSDFSDDIELSNKKIEFAILKVNSPVHFKIRINKIFEKDGTINDLLDIYYRYLKELNNFYANKDNHRAIDMILPEDTKMVYLNYDEEGDLIECSPCYIKSKLGVAEYRILNLQTNEIMLCSDKNLVHINERFSDIPMIVKDLHLMDLRHPDGETFWPEEVNKKIWNHISRDNDFYSCIDVSLNFDLCTRSIRKTNKIDQSLEKYLTFMKFLVICHDDSLTVLQQRIIDVNGTNTSKVKCETGEDVSVDLIQFSTSDDGKNNSTESNILDRDNTVDRSIDILHPYRLLDIDDDQEEVSYLDTSNTVSPGIVCTYKRLNIKWSQEETLIDIDIDAPNLQPEEYSIEVSINTIGIKAIISNELRVAALKLYSIIDTANVIHGIVGRRLRIILFKSIPGMNWNRLTEYVIPGIQYISRLNDSDERLFPRSRIIRLGEKSSSEKDIEDDLDDLF